MILVYFLGLTPLLSPPIFYGRCLCKKWAGESQASVVFAWQEGGTINKFNKITVFIETPTRR